MKDWRDYFAEKMRSLYVSPLNSMVDIDASVAWPAVIARRMIEALRDEDLVRFNGDHLAAAAFERAGNHPWVRISGDPEKLHYIESAKRRFHQHLKARA